MYLIRWVSDLIPSTSFLELDMQRKFLTLPICALVLLTFGQVSVQADISGAGSIIDTGNTVRTGSVTAPVVPSEVNQWSNTTFIKTLDIDGDNRYGTDGVFLANTTAQNAGAGSAVTFERVPTFTSPVVASAGNNISGNFQNANGTTGFIQNDVNDATIRLGYAGFTGPNDTAIPLTDLFTYTLTADQAVGETLRLGVFGGTNNSDTRLGFTTLGVTAGGEFASAIDDRATNTGNATDLYFFDITGLVAGDEIVISAANSNLAGNNFNAATIGGVTFDTTIAVPEPSSLAVLGLSAMGLLIRRRK